jgi:hypothetical protein
MRVEEMERRLQRNPKLRWRVYKRKAIIEPAIGLNETGTLIWELCDGSKTIRDIVEYLSREFSGDPSHIRESVVKFIDLLLRQASSNN